MPKREIDAAAEQELFARVKVELRQRMRALRRVMPGEARDVRSAAICKRLGALEPFLNARTIVAYAATRTEADPSRAVAIAREAGKVVGLPRIADDGRLELRRYHIGDELVTSQHGIDEPSSSAPSLADEAVDLIIVPALALDTRGHRIGYGQGYYDRLLPRLTRAFKVGIGFDFQLVVQTPDTPFDVPVDCVVTDARVSFIEQAADGSHLKDRTR
jgi:5-formyltetrahydrofolate cyclo-ligase